MRYSNDVRVVEEQISSGQQLFSLGTREEVRNRLEQLLNTALERGDDGRVATLIAAIDQLDNMPASSLADIPSAQPATEESEDWEQYFVQPSQLSPAPSHRPAAPVESGPLDCPICFDTVEEVDVRYFRACGHRYCKDCLDQHLRTLIDEGKVSSKELICPSPGCGESPEPEEVQELVTPETYDKFIQFLVLNELKTDTNARWCINKQCAQPILWDPSVPKVVCPACHTEFCFNCKGAWHEGACPFVRTKEDEQFVRYLKAQGTASKPCPQCHTAIEKNSGCNHMTVR